MNVQWGITGCGDVVRKRVAAAIRQDPGSRLVALCRRDREALQALAAEHEVQRLYVDERELFADPEVHAVYVATPVADHHRQTIAAARAGKHVLVEKPMAMSVAECDAMIAACNEAGVCLGVAYYRPFYPLVKRMLQLMADGEIGVPLSVTAVCCNALRVAEDRPLPWRVSPEFGGGGPLMDIGSHRLDLFREVFGPIQRASGYCPTLAAGYPVEDSCAAVVQFAGGHVGNLQCYFGVEFDLDLFQIRGSEGTLTAQPLNGATLKVDIGAGSRREAHLPAANLNTPLVADFREAVLAGRPPKIDGMRGRETNRVIAEIYQAGQVA